MREKLEKILNSETFVVYEMVQEAALLRYIINENQFKVIIYGAGGRGRICLRWLKTEGIKVEFFVDGNEKRSSSIIDGVKVIHFTQIKSKLQEEKVFAIIATTAAQVGMEENIIWKCLYENGVSDVMNPFKIDNTFPDYQTKFITYYLDNKSKLLNVLELFEDEESKENFCEFVEVKFRHKRWERPQLSFREKYWGTIPDSDEEGLYTHLQDENWINCGSSIGDSIVSFIEKGFQFKNIYAFEGEANSVTRMKTLMKYFPKEIVDKISIFNCYLGDESEELNFDSILAEKKISLMNMDIEGAELSVLTGAKNIICKQLPVLAICVYHRPEDLVAIPTFVKECSDDYHLYLRKYQTYFGSIRGEIELVMYAIPKARLGRNQNANRK